VLEHELSLRWSENSLPSCVGPEWETNSKSVNLIIHESSRDTAGGRAVMLQAGISDEIVSTSVMISSPKHPDRPWGPARS
jgi:hypothetical protein